MSFILHCFLITLLLEKVFLCYLGVFGSLIYYCPVNRLCFIILFTRLTSSPLSLNLVFYSYYLLQKASLYPGVLIYHGIASL